MVEVQPSSKLREMSCLSVTWFKSTSLLPSSMTHQQSNCSLRSTKFVYLATCVIKLPLSRHFHVLSFNLQPLPKVLRLAVRRRPFRSEGETSRLRLPPLLSPSRTTAAALFPNFSRRAICPTCDTRKVEKGRGTETETAKSTTTYSTHRPLPADILKPSKKVDFE